MESSHTATTKSIRDTGYRTRNMAKQLFFIATIRNFEGFILITKNMVDALVWMLATK